MLASEMVIDWRKCALRSEIEFSKALLSQPVIYTDFIHLFNPHVPWGGDFNRIIDGKITRLDQFDRIVTQVNRIHKDKGLDKPDRFDIRAPVLDETHWKDYLLDRGYRLLTAIFFNSPTQLIELPTGFTLYTPTPGEYFDWYEGSTKLNSYYEDGWFKRHLSLKANFIQVFKPYWLLNGKDLVGWVYSANLGRYTRLFEVEIDKSFRGSGMGRLLLQAMIGEGYRQATDYVLLQSSEQLRQFYEKCGFRECSSNSVIRLIE